MNSFYKKTFPTNAASTDCVVTRYVSNISKTNAAKMVTSMDNVASIHGLTKFNMRQVYNTATLKARTSSAFLFN